MKRFLMNAVMGLFALSMVACGGGGGSSGGGGGSSSGGSQYSITLDKSSVQLSAVYGDISGSSVNVTATFKGDGVLVGYPPGVEPPGWLIVDTGIATATTAQFQLSAHPFGIPAGTYTTTLRFITGDANNESSAVHKDLTVTFNFSDSLTLNGMKIYEETFWGHSLEDRPFFFDVQTSGLTWTATSNVDWLRLEPSSTLGFHVDAYLVGVDSLPVGDNIATITVTSTTGGFSQSFNANYHIRAPEVSVSEESLEFSMAMGAQSDSVEVVVDLPYLQSDVAWTTQPSHDWLKATASGMTGEAITVYIDGSAFSEEGDIQGIIEIQLAVPGTAPIEIPVTVHVQALRMFVHNNGVAFVKVPGSATLTQTRTVLDTGYSSVDLGLVPISDQSWLSASIDGRVVTLSADPEGLPNGLYYGQVTLVANDNRITGNEIIKTALYVSDIASVSGTLVSFTTQEIWSLKAAFREDPIRPYVYVASNLNNDIQVRNIYSGELVTTYTPGGVGEIKNLAVSNNGDLLLVQDSTKTEVQIIDLTTGTSLPSVYAGASFYYNNNSFAFIRPDGRDMMIWGQCLFDLETDTLAGLLNYDDYPQQPYDCSTDYSGVAVARDLPAAVRGNRTLFGYDETSGRTVARLRWFGGVPFDRDIFVNNDATVAYAPDYGGNGYGWGIWTMSEEGSVQTGKLVGPAYPVAVVRDDRGFVYGGRSDSADAILVFASNNANVGDIDTQGTLYDNSLRISGDGMRLLNAGYADTYETELLIEVRNTYQLPQ